MATATPPPEVLTEFLHALSRLVGEWDEGFAPVLRGSLLLSRWYGPRARPPADIDLECFTNPVEQEDYGDDPPDYDDEQPYGPTEGRFGRDGEFVSRVDLGKAMCRYAAGMAGYRRPGGNVGIAFENDAEPPADGTSLWVYGTPGRRYYATWEWPGHEPSAGRLQLDLSSPGPYTRDDLGVTDEAFVAPGAVGFRVAAYSREAMLAAKVSWLMRGFARSPAGTVTWAGEPKDLFDAHLLATDDALRPDVFRRAMLSVGTADALDWTALGRLFEVRRTTGADDAFGNWPEFASRHPGLTSAGPAALWAELADRLGPLFGNLDPAAEQPFLAGIRARPDDKLLQLVYADWLEERDDPRGQVLRLIAEVVSSEGAAGVPAARQEAVKAIAGVSRAWLHQVFGASANWQSFLTATGAG